MASDEAAVSRVAEYRDALREKADRQPDHMQVALPAEEVADELDDVLCDSDGYEAKPFRPEDFETLDRAVETWGIEAQIDMAVEECAELIVALEHLKRDLKLGELGCERDFGWAAQDVFEELTDVTVMREQLVRFFDDYDEQRHVARSMGQLRSRLESTEGADDGQ